jgi:hypothetical protein
MDISIEYSLINFEVLKHLVVLLYSLNLSFPILIFVVALVFSAP